MTASWAMRLTVAPERNGVSRAQVVSTRSAPVASVEPGSLVRAMVVAPRSAAAWRGSVVSSVSPEWETARATSPGPSRAVAVSAACRSLQMKAIRPMRCSFWCRSWPTNALAPTPKISTLRALATASTARPSASTSSAAPESSRARTSL